MWPRTGPSLGGGGGGGAVCPQLLCAAYEPEKGDQKVWGGLTESVHHPEYHQRQ